MCERETRGEDPRQSQRGQRGQREGRWLCGAGQGRASNKGGLHYQHARNRMQVGGCGAMSSAQGRTTSRRCRRSLSWFAVSLSVV